MKQALARLVTECDHRPDGQSYTRIRVLRSDWPLMLRATMPLEQDATTAWTARDAPPARVHLSAGAAGPVGGDQQRLEIRIGPGSALILGEVSSTLLLPGPRGEESRTEVDIRVGAGGTLAWLPQLVIAAQGCRHHIDVRVMLEPGARLLLREQTRFGRHDEPSGTLRQHLRLVLDDRPLYDQELIVGPAGPGWDGPAVTGGNRSVGSLLVVDPAERARPRNGSCERGTAVMALPGPGVLVSALALDTTTLRRKLDSALTHVLTHADGSESTFP